MSEAERILAHIEAGHTEVYPLCAVCQAGSAAQRHRDTVAAAANSATLPDRGENDPSLSQFHHTTD